MDKDVARQITQLREEIDSFATGRDLPRIGLKQTHAGALYAIWMASRHGYLALARSRATANAQREQAMCDALLGAIADEDEAPTGDWVGDYYFGSALLQVAATIYATLKHRYLPLYGEGFCRSPARLLEQAGRDDLISAADNRLLAAIQEAAGAYKHDHGQKGSVAATSLNDLVLGLRVVVGVARETDVPPSARAARG